MVQALNQFLIISIIYVLYVKLNAIIYLGDNIRISHRYKSIALNCLLSKNNYFVKVIIFRLIRYIIFYLMA